MRWLIGQRLRSPALIGVQTVQPGAIAGGLVTFTRSQVGTVSTAFNATADLVEYAADVPRFNGAAQRLLLEGQSTNVWTNPRGDGLVAGTPGSNPTGAGTRPANGLVAEIIGQATRNGIPGWEFRISGTPASTGINTWALGGATAHLVGDFVWTAAWFALVGGSLANIANMTLRGSDGDAGVSVIGMTATPQFFSRRWVSTSNTGTQPRLRWSFADTVTPVDCTIWIGGGQQRIGPAFLDSAILPVSGSPAASTRGQDNFTSAFATLFPNGVGTVLGSFMLSSNADGADQVLIDINDGTANNRIRLRNVAGGATIVAGRTIGGVNADATTLGSMTAGTLFRVGLTFDGTTLVANFNGGSNESVVGLPPGLTVRRVGNNAAGTAPMFGEVGYLQELPYVIPAFDLPAAVAAIPS